MLWGQDIKFYTDHKNLTRDALGLTSDRVYHWQLLLEEYAPKIIHIKGIHNTVADTVSRLEYDPKLNKTNEYTHAMLGVEPEELSAQQWKSFVHHWRCPHEDSAPTQAHCIHMNEVFANCSDEDEIYSKRAAPATMPTSGLKVLWVYKYAQKRKNCTGKFKCSLPGN
jgi:hypothetical protein